MSWGWVCRPALLGASLICCAAAFMGCVRRDVTGEAVLLADRGEEEKAIQLLTAYLGEHPNATRERQLLLRLYASLGNLAAAEKQAELLARALGNHSPLPWVELGHAMELQHRYEDALLLYDKAAEIAPRDPTGPRVGGLRAAHWGELDVAAERLTEALRRDPKSAEVWHALGVVELQRGNEEAAERAYASGLRADPNSAENHLGQATLALRRRAYVQALAHYDVLIALRPKLPNLHLGRSWTLIQLGRTAEAREALARAQQLGGDPGVIREQLKLLAGSAQNTQKHPQNR